MPSEVEFGAALRGARTDRCWTLEQAARKLTLLGCRAVAPKFLSRLEAGHHTPLHDKTLRDLSRLYGFPDGYLVGLLRYSGADLTFGAAIREARLMRGLTLVKVCRSVKGESGRPISRAYLNHLEQGRRSPPGDRIVYGLADKLGLQSDWLLYLLGRFPADIRKKNLDSDAIRTIFSPLRNS